MGRAFRNHSNGTACIFLRPRAQPAQSLDFQQLLVKAHTSVGVRFSEREQKPQPGEEPQDAQTGCFFGRWGCDPSSSISSSASSSSFLPIPLCLPQPFVLVVLVVVVVDDDDVVAAPATAVFAENLCVASYVGLGC